MKYIFSLFTAFAFFFAAGCSDNAVSSTTDGGLGGGIGGGTQGGTVSFTIMSQPGQNNGIELLAKPNVDVTLTSVNVKVASENYDFTYQGDGTTVYPKDQWHLMDEYTGTSPGMQFVFTFIGKTSPDKKDFNVTSNYTIP